MSLQLNMINKKFNKLTVLSEAGRSPQGRILFNCECECGNMRIVSGTSLRANHITQCKACKHKAVGENNQQTEDDVRRKILARFAGQEGCWEWDQLSTKGYAIVTVLGKQKRVPRIMANTPEDKLACHHCDNPACVNPTHIFNGTAFDNMHDMIEKGRDYKPGRKTKQAQCPKIGRFIGV